MTSPPPPEDLLYGAVTWTALTVSADADDPDALPDLTPISGRVIFTAARSLLTFPGSPPKTVFLLPVEATLDTNGVLRDQQGREQVMLVATDNQDSSHVNWTWTARFILDGGVTRPNFSFNLPAGTVVDLTRATPVDVSAGQPIIVGPDGPAGADGPSAYEVAVAEGFTGTRAEWLASLVGGGTAISDHGNLDGLLDDDHPQYLRVDDADQQTYSAVAAMLTAGPNVAVRTDNDARTITISAADAGSGGGGGGVGSVQTGLLEAVLFYDQFTGWPQRPDGYARVIWVDGPSRPPAMAAYDLWEHIV